MIKLLIVDDERLVRELIRLSVNWEEIGFSIVGTAATAEEGIEMVDELKPDVVFTDVRMPGQTGLDLARTIVDKYPLIKVVVISGYDEFAYVNEGLKIGIFDYLLKPIAEEALRDVGCKVRDAILAQRKHNEEFEHYKKEFELNYNEIKEKAISRLVYSSEAELVAENLKVFHIELNEDTFQAAVLEYGRGIEYETENELLEAIRIREIANEFFAAYDHIFLFEKSYPYIVIINNQKDVDFNSLCQDVCRFIAETVSAEVYIGVGSFYKNLWQLSISYREAKSALKYNFTKQNGKCIFFQEIMKNQKQEPSFHDLIIKNYSDYISQGMIHEAREILKSIYVNAKHQDLTKDQAIFMTINLIIETYTAAKELKIDLNSMEKFRTKIVSDILSMTDLLEMENSILNLLDQLFETFRKNNETKNANVVTNMEEYIKAHYEEPDLSLAKIADIFYMNPNYLSRAFKKKTKKTFREYLLDYRMEKAIILLRQTSLKGYEVADKVGIQDPNYFSVCFKKKFGYSVRDMDR